MAYFRAFAISWLPSRHEINAAFGWLIFDARGLVVVARLMALAVMRVAGSGLSARA